MKLEKLRLRGWIGILRGIGLQEIEIDFSGVEGLIALDGVNGSGKSTCLELLSPYSRLASRDGSFAHHVYSRTAERELSFSYAGHQYRTLIKVDCQSEKQEGFIWKDGTSQVNGKITEYNKYIKNLLGSPDLFYASVFCSQNSTKLSDMTTGQLKGLFGEFLRLERFQGWEKKAKQKADISGGQAEMLDARIKALNEQIVGKIDLDGEYASLGQKIDFLYDDKHVLKKSLVEKRLIVDDLNKAISNNMVWMARKTDIEKSMAGLIRDKDTEKNAADGEIESLKKKYRELAEELKKHVGILQDKEAIEGAAAKEKELQGKIDTLGAGVDRLAEEIGIRQKDVHALDKEVQELKNILSQVAKDIINPEKDAELISLKSKAKSLKEKMADLQRKDETCQSVTCSFIKGALDAAGELPIIEKGIDDREAAIKKSNEEFKAEYVETGDKLNQKGEALKAAKAVLQTGSQVLEEKRKALAGFRYDLLKVKELAAKASIVQVAEQRKADIEKQQAEITEQGKAKREASNKRVADLNLEIDAKKVEAEECERSIDHDAECKLKALNAEIEKIETNDLVHIEKDITESREKIATIKAALEKMTDAGKELEEVQNQKEMLTRNTAEWRYLQAACGKNGLQALEIDGAAPLITSYANDLLSQAFGPLFSVKLVTQDEEGKECLDIIVLTDDGSEILLDNLSGGQKVWNLMALRLAMTLLSKEKSGRGFHTAFADELDGALDPGNALNFVNMYRSFMKIGGFSNFLFISHKPSCRGLADHILKFEQGKNPYWG